MSRETEAFTVGVILGFAVGIVAGVLFLSWGT
jgi:galactitol-specific phosphotransferase system IIC component